MTTSPDLLAAVVVALEQRRGRLRRIARDTGLSYDTVLRVKNGEGDPGYRKVTTLADHLGISCHCCAPADASRAERR